MKRARLVLGASLVIFGGVTVVFLALFISKSHDISKYKRQASNLQTQLSSSNKQNDDLSSKLNKANSTISQLSDNGSFVDGSACQTQQLSLSQEDIQGHNPGGAAGTIGQLFSYQNTSKSSCTIQGYPGFLALDNKGYVIPNGPVATGPNYTHVTAFSNPGSKLITLATNDKAYFVVSWSDVVPAPGQVCIKPTLIESSPPGAELPLILIANGTGQMCSYGISVSALGQLSDF